MFGGGPDLLQRAGECPLGLVAHVWRVVCAAGGEESNQDDGEDVSCHLLTACSSCLMARSSGAGSCDVGAVAIVVVVVEFAGPVWLLARWSVTTTIRTTAATTPPTRRLSIERGGRRVCA